MNEMKYLKLHGKQKDNQKPKGLVIPSLPNIGLLLDMTIQLDCAKVLCLPVILVTHMCSVIAK